MPIGFDVVIEHRGPRPLSPAGFARVAQFLTSELGFKMPDSKSVMIQSRLLRRVTSLGMESVDQYVEYLFAPQNFAEREYFINAITTNKTDFFREMEHFIYLNDVVLHEFTHHRARTGRFQVWSAGCSSGEEPYTLAMVLAEYAARVLGFDFAILATDVSTKVLGEAQEGIYPRDRILPVPPELRRKYLLASRDGGALARIVPSLRTRISFHQLNFMEEPYPVRDTFDAIFFRNVMIYFDRSTQEKVVNRLCRNLAPGGYLFAGHSESLTGLDVPLRSVKASVYCKDGQ
ncbi:MAG TPA: CheR family methyltransferase [Bryobacteraceae bacterium]|nr:CheR family methyltransferase [Bryobacteraceae bacterium]